jgi:hypothetical protein
VQGRAVWFGRGCVEEAGGESTQGVGGGLGGVGGGRGAGAGERGGEAAGGCTKSGEERSAVRVGCCVGLEGVFGGFGMGYESGGDV